MNIELLKKVRDKIATTPEAYDQSIWGRSAKDAPCGTAACIAGWAAHLSGHAPLERLQNNGNSTSIGDIAQRELGIDYFERSTLFSAEPSASWPDPYNDDWDNAGSPQERATVAVAFLDEIIDTGEVREGEGEDDDWDDDEDW
jgi:hypothetical protein